MRAYQIDLFAPGNTGTTPDKSYTSLNDDGSSNPGALTIEMDVQVAPYASVNSDANPYIRVWGISLQEISSAGNYNGYGISVYGGMQKGLPLANPQQYGLLFQGTVLQCFGNWIELDQTLDFYVIAANADAGSKNPVNLVLLWKEGTPLGEAVQNTLQTAYPAPGYTVVNKTSQNLVLNYDAPGFYQNITQFAQLVKQVSQQIIGGDYPGVDIVLTKTTFTIYDGTTPNTPVPIKFQDLIGQPTWIAPPTIQITCVMRADLQIDDYITMPSAIYTTTAAAQSYTTNTKANFQGTFRITSIRHVGNFRQEDAASWVTIIEAVTPITSTTGQPAGEPASGP